MSKTGHCFCALRNQVFFLTLLGVTVLVCQQALARPNGNHRFAMEVQPVLRTYPIVRAYASEAERVLNDVFKQRSISVSHNANQNSVHIWATDAEHAHIEYFLKQQQMLGIRQPSQTTSRKLIARLHQQQGGGNAIPAAQDSASMRFADLQPRDTGQNVPAYWQNHNVPQQNTMRQVAGQTQQVQTPPPFGAPPVAGPSVGAPPVTGGQVANRIALKKSPAGVFETNILNALRTRVQPQRSDLSATQTLYVIPLPNNQRLEMTIDRQSNFVSLAGPAGQVETFNRLVEYVDNGQQPEGVLGVVPVTPGNAQPLQDFARMVNQSANQFSGQFAGQQNPPRTATQGTEMRITPSTNQANGDSASPLLPPDVSGLVGPVEVTILDGFVVINARTPGDLALLTEIINYIEASSREYDPTIIEVPMIHADCMRVTVVALQLYNEWYAPQRGPVSATPLVRPNSILLIGYPGGVQSIRELIAKLDAPVDAAAQIQTFPLKHISSTSVQTVITNIYTPRNQVTTTPGVTIPTGQGLASPVIVTSDAQNNLIIVQAAPRDLLEIAALIIQLDKPNNDVDVRVKVIPLRNSTAVTMQTILTQALAQQVTAGVGGGLGGQVTAPQPSISFTTIDAARGERINGGIFAGVTFTADANGNNIVVKAPASCMPLIEAVIQSLDGPPLAVAQIKIFTIINGDASSMLAVLNSIFGATTGGAAGVQPTYSMGNTNENSALVPVRFAPETRTNSIIATGSADMLAMVEAVILTLDEPEMHNRRMMVYRLLNTPAATIATTLQNFLQNERQLRQQTNVMVGDMDVFTSEVIVQAETETNSLLVSTTPNRFEQLRRMIQVLDERPAMVQIAVLIGEVDLSNTKELGFELGLQDALLFNRGILNQGDYTYRTVTTNTPGVGSVQEQIIISESRTPGINFNNMTVPLGNNAAGNSGNVGAQGVSNFSLGRQNSEMGYGGFVFSASSESVSVLIRALEESRKLTVLNRPMINALHNQESRISVGERVQMIQGGTINDITGQQTNNVIPTDVGVILTVTPRISLDDSVALLINAEKSSLGPEGEGTPIFAQSGVTIRAPRIKQASITTTIRAQSGQVAILGGLIAQEESHTHRAVPLISKIPVVGQLFQYNNRYCTRKEIIFIFTPQVYRSEDEADTLKQLELMRMHWCTTHVAGMFNTDSIRTRVDNFTPSDTIIETGSSIRLNEREAPSDERILGNPAWQNRTAPQPSLAPTLPKPSF